LGEEPSRRDFKNGWVQTKFMNDATRASTD
jgi:hypothetical protein